MSWAGSPASPSAQVHEPLLHGVEAVGDLLYLVPYGSGVLGAEAATVRVAGGEPEHERGCDQHPQ